VVGEGDAVGGKERLDRIAGDRHPEIRVFFVASDDHVEQRAVESEQRAAAATDRLR
jgi:hypothetical protein